MSDYRSILKEEYTQRRTKNGSYSLRAFARDLEVSPAFLTLLFNGKKSLSEERAHVVSDRLGWPKAKQKIFTTLVRYDGARSLDVKADILGELSDLKAQETKFFQLKLDTFRMISDWYHYAIIELTALEDFAPTPKNLATELGISMRDVRQAIARLKRVGLLKEKDGKLQKVVSNYATFDIPSEAIRSFHRQMLRKAMDAIDGQAGEERDLSGITMAIDPSFLPQARIMIREFANELMELMESGKKKAIYQFSVQLFKLNKGKT